MKRLFSLLLSFSILFSFSTFFVFAQTTSLPPSQGPTVTLPPSGGFTLPNPIQADSFSEVMRRVANIAALIGLPVVVLMIIWTGAQFVFAGGDEKKLTAAKQSFYWTIIGALLVLGAYVIAAAIENFARQL